MSQQHSGGSPWSETASIQLASDYMPPAAPSNLSATERTERIELTWNNPTENKDGSFLYDHVDEHCKVYYSDSSGIDPIDDTTYDGVFDVYGARAKFDSEQTSTTFYFVVTAIDREGNPSQASSEVSASPKAVSVTTSLDDYTDNFESDPLIGDGQIGIVFKQPDSLWSGFSRYKLYYDEDTGSGFSGSWTELYEGAESYYRHTFLDSSHYYKYKLTFIDEDGDETSGTIKDNGGTGWQPNNADNSSLQSEPFFAGIIVADDEVRASHIEVGSLSAIQKLTGNIGTAESGARVEIFPDSNTGIQVIDDGGNDVFLANVGGTNVGDVVIGDLAGDHIQWDKSASNLNVKGGITITGGSGIANLTDAGDLATKDAALVSNGDVVIDGSLSITGDIQSNNFSSGSTGWKIDGANDSAEFQDITARGSIEITGGSGISNLTDAGDLAEQDAALVSNGDVVIDGDLTISAGGKITTDGGDVELGTNVLSGGGDGLRIKNGGGVEVTDATGRTIFDSSSNFKSVPRVSDISSQEVTGDVNGNSEATVFNVGSETVVVGGMVVTHLGDATVMDDCYLEISDDSGSEKIYQPTNINDSGDASRFGHAPESGKPMILYVLPYFQAQGSCTIKIYNEDNFQRNYHGMLQTV